MFQQWLLTVFSWLAIAGFSAALAFLSARLADGELPEENEIARVPPRTKPGQGPERANASISRFVL